MVIVDVKDNDDVESAHWLAEISKCEIPKYLQKYQYNTLIRRINIGIGHMHTY